MHRIGRSRTERRTGFNENECEVQLVKDLEYHLYEEAKSGRMTRQQVLVRASVLGVSASALGAILAACGSSASSGTSAGGSTPAGAIKKGGTGIFGITSRSEEHTSELQS